LHVISLVGKSIENGVVVLMHHMRFWEDDDSGVLMFCFRFCNNETWHVIS
jgi:hypothetical protein